MIAHIVHLNFYILTTNNELLIASMLAAKDCVEPCLYTHFSSIVENSFLALLLYINRRISYFFREYMAIKLKTFQAVYTEPEHFL